MSNLMRKKKSVIWKYFTPLTENLAICNLCRRKISYRSSSSNLKKHLKCRHKGISFVSSVSGNKRQLMDLFHDHISCSDISDSAVEIEIMQSENLVDINECVAENMEEAVVATVSKQEAHEQQVQKEEMSVKSSEDINATCQNNNSQKISNSNSNSRIERVFMNNRKKMWEEFNVNNDHQYQKNLQNQTQLPTTTVAGIRVTEDSYDFFGKYIASMLREMGPPLCLALQEEIISLVLRKRCYLE